ncbi:MAG: hypothetical protein U1C74_24705, partial [Phenylobacterium sp.]|nr:hypothetical protein [Phenylobacterium sp.]
MIRTFAAAAVLTLAGLAASPAMAQAPAGALASDQTQVVRVKQGALKGPVKDGVAYHLGIPFAAP